MEKGKVDLHLNLEKELFLKMEKLRSKKSRTKFIEDLIKNREVFSKVSLSLEKVKLNQKRIFAMLVLIASELGISSEEIQKINEIKEEKYG